MIRNKKDCRQLIPAATMHVTRQRVACLGWTITRYGDSMTLATTSDKRAVSETELVGLLWENRKAINDDYRLA